VLKAGKIMTKQKFGTTLLSRLWLTVTCCAEKSTIQIPKQATVLRLFKV